VAASKFVFGMDSRSGQTLVANDLILYPGLYRNKEKQSSRKTNRQQDIQVTSSSSDTLPYLDHQAAQGEHAY